MPDAEDRDGCGVWIVLWPEIPLISVWLVITRQSIKVVVPEVPTKQLSSHMGSRRGSSGKRSLPKTPSPKGSAEKGSENSFSSNSAKSTPTNKSDSSWQGLKLRRGNHPEREPTCSICLRDIGPKLRSVVHAAGGCNANFHRSCLKEWTDERKNARAYPRQEEDAPVTCPHCRGTMWHQPFIGPAPSASMAATMEDQRRHARREQAVREQDARDFGQILGPGTTGLGSGHFTLSRPGGRFGNFHGNGHGESGFLRPRALSSQDESPVFRQLTATSESEPSFDPFMRQAAEEAVEALRDFAHIPSRHAVSDFARVYTHESRDEQLRAFLAEWDGENYIPVDALEQYLRRLGVLPSLGTSGYGQAGPSTGALDV